MLKHRDLNNETADKPTVMYFFPTQIIRIIICQQLGLSCTMEHKFGIYAGAAIWKLHIYRTTAESWSKEQKSRTPNGKRQYGLMSHLSALFLHAVCLEKANRCHSPVCWYG